MSSDKPFPDKHRSSHILGKSHAFPLVFFRPVSLRFGQ